MSSEDLLEDFVGQGKRSDNPNIQRLVPVENMKLHMEVLSNPLLHKRPQQRPACKLFRK